MIAVVFALPEESREFARALDHFGRSAGAGGPLGAWLGNFAEEEILLFHTGMGVDRVRARFGPFLDAAPEPLRFVLSVGFAGGINPALKEGALLLAENRSDPGFLRSAKAILRERAALARLLTVPAPVEAPAEKAELARVTGADAIDMETEALHALCEERGLPLLSLRVISDSATQEVAVPFSVCYGEGRLQIGALLRYLFRHPSAIRPFIRFSLSAVASRKVLNAAALELIEKLLKRL